MSWRCSICERPLGRTRLVINGWQSICPGCAYRREYGWVEDTTPVEEIRREIAPLQSEGLFPLPPPVRKPRRG
jgi:hypothetical protein